MGIEAYNKHLNMFIHIDEGEELCPKCHGRGMVPLKEIFKTKKARNLTCSRCYGKGKIDWVQKAMRR